MFRCPSCVTPGVKSSGPPLLFTLSRRRVPRFLKSEQAARCPSTPEMAAKEFQRRMVVRQLRMPYIPSSREEAGGRISPLRSLDGCLYRNDGNASGTQDRRTLAIRSLLTRGPPHDSTSGTSSASAHPSSARPAANLAGSPLPWAKGRMYCG